MANKSHLKFLNKKQLSEIKDFKYNYGFDNNKDDEDVAPKNYFRQATSLRADVLRFTVDVKEKNSLRDDSIEIPCDIDYVNIVFQDQFVINKYFHDYYNDFGLEATAFYDFAKKGLFAIVDRDKFQTFITNVNNFILQILDNNQEIKYSNYIKYISEFKLLKANDILKVRLENIGEIAYL